MILAIDVGNTNIVVGCVEGRESLFVERLSTDSGKTAMEYAVLFRSVLYLHDILPDRIEGSILSSVVPLLGTVLTDAMEKILPGKPHLSVGPGLKTGLPIAIDNPAQLGADLVVAAVAALAEHMAPLIVIDMGTATTLSAIDQKGVFRGVSIMPGLRVSMQSLSSSAALLTDIGLSAPKRAIGTNTADSMRSGLMFGAAGMLDGLIDRMQEELGTPCTVIATGGLARFVIPLCRHEIVYDDALLLKGLKILYDKNINS